MSPNTSHRRDRPGPTGVSLMRDGAYRGITYIHLRQAGSQQSARTGTGTGSGTRTGDQCRRRIFQTARSDQHLTAGDELVRADRGMSLRRGGAHFRPAGTQRHSARFYSCTSYDTGEPTRGDVQWRRDLHQLCGDDFLHGCRRPTKGADRNGETVADVVTTTVGQKRNANFGVERRASRHPYTSGLFTLRRATAPYVVTNHYLAPGPIGGTWVAADTRSAGSPARTHARTTRSAELAANTPNM